MNDLIELVRTRIRGIWRYRWSALLTAAVVGLLGAGLALLLPNKYEATARIFVDTQSILKPLMAGLAVQPNLDQQVRMMAQTLLNRPNLDRMMKMSDLDLRVSDIESRDRLLDRLSVEIRLRPAGGTNLYSVAYRNEDPESARKVVQSLVTIFLESNLGDKRRDSEQAKKFIDEQIVIYENRLAVAENALKEFKVRNLGLMPGGTQNYVSRAADAREELAVARDELRQAEGARDALKRELALEGLSNPMPESTASSPEVAQPTDTDLRLQAATKRLDELLVRYTDEHPDVIATRSTIAQFEAQQRRERALESKRRETLKASSVPVSNVNPAYNAIRTSLAETEARVASLKARVASAQSKVAASIRAAETVPKVEADLAQLNRDYEINKKNYEQLLTRRESAQMSGSMESAAGTTELRVIDPPRVAPQPVSPNRAILLAAAFAVSLIAGLAMAYLRDMLASTFSSVHALAAGTNAQVIGAVSEVLQAGTAWRRRLGAMAFSAGALAYVAAFGVAIALVMLKPSLLSSFH